MAVRRHPEGLAELVAPALHPHAQHEVKGHVGNHDRGVAVSQAGRVVGPVRWVVDTDRISDPRWLDVAGASDRLAPSRRYVLAEGARPDRPQRGLHALAGDLGEPLHLIRGLAEIDRARHRDVVAQPAPAQLEAGRRVVAKWLVGPG